MTPLHEDEHFFAQLLFVDARVKNRLVLDKLNKSRQTFSALALFVVTDIISVSAWLFHDVFTLFVPFFNGTSLETNADLNEISTTIVAIVVTNPCFLCLFLLLFGTSSQYQDKVLSEEHK